MRTIQDGDGLTFFKCPPISAHLQNVHGNMLGTLRKTGRFTIKPNTVVARGQDGAVDLIEKDSGLLTVRIFSSGEFLVCVYASSRVYDSVTTFTSSVLPKGTYLMRRNEHWRIVCENEAYNEAYDERFEGSPSARQRPATIAA